MVSMQAVAIMQAVLTIFSMAIWIKNIHKSLVFSIAMAILTSFLFHLMSIDHFILDWRAPLVQFLSLEKNLVSILKRWWTINGSGITQITQMLMLTRFNVTLMATRNGYIKSYNVWGSITFLARCCQIPDFYQAKNNPSLNGPKGLILSHSNHLERNGAIDLQPKTA